MSSVTILQVYSLTQLVWVATSKLEEQRGNITYPSILVPPALDPGLVVLHNNISLAINVLLILSSLSAWLAVCKVIKSLRAFVKTNVPQLVYNLTDIKYFHRPVSAK